MASDINLSNIYHLRKQFIVIGLTGRTGSGCSEVAELLEAGFDAHEFLYPNKNEFQNDIKSFRRYRIIYNYAEKNFKPFHVITYRHVFTWLILRHSFEELIEFLKDKSVINEISEHLDNIPASYEKEIEELETIKDEFNANKSEVTKADKNAQERQYEDLYGIYFSSGFVNFSEKLHDILKRESCIKHYKLFHLISNSLRLSAYPYNYYKNVEPKKLDNIYYIADLINHIIKSIREVKRKNGEKNAESDTACRVVIDSLRNPLEIMYFKERYSAFYMFSINRDDAKRKLAIKERYKNPNESEAIEIIEKEEHKGGRTSEFYKQDVSECIQKSDIHLDYVTDNETNEINGLQNNEINILPIKRQLLKYVALIGQPGLVTPTAQERCMQIAYTAKYNSGCISRQVGALITDGNFSIKAVGWNDVPTGHVPCSLRNIEDYLSMDSENDYNAYSEYEKSESDGGVDRPGGKTFRQAVEEYYSKIIENGERIEEYSSKLEGRNVCFCFKQLQNHIADGKNQVHTRALHAEENAFLQIVKYGGQGISNGILFSTASPCELCSKKAVQLNIKTIYYIDPYPGIATDHILRGGTQKPELRQFVGAIGKAYHKFYESFMPYKDELSLILGIEIPDYAAVQVAKCK